MFVDTESKFTVADQYLKNARAIALDAEWKPITTRKVVSGQQSPRVSILQIACLLGPAARKDVLGCESATFRSRTQEEPVSEGDEIITIILDMLALPPTCFSESLRSVLRSPNIIKLGYGLRDDMRHLAKNNCDTEARNCFDLVRIVGPCPAQKSLDCPISTVPTSIATSVDNAYTIQATKQQYNEHSNRNADHRMRPTT